MVTVKSEVCFDSGQFAGGTKNLQDQCVVVISHQKVGQYDELSHFFGKIFE